MKKVFLSHSSRDKENYVEIVANKLKKNIGEENIILDELTFEAGRMTIEEIQKGLNETDLFVFFISENSLNSEWVEKEVFRAYELWEENKINQICPIIISKNVKYDNEKIPNWLKENYNLVYISRPTKAAQIIEERMIELSFKSHPRLKEKNEIFVGRNNLIALFEERMDNFEKIKPISIIASGINSIGRKTLLKKCIYKSNIKKPTYPFSKISLNYDESIEDFILKIYDLGFENKIEKKLENLISKTLDEKIRLASDLIMTIQNLSDIMFLEDNGSIISAEGEFSYWFGKILEQENIKNKVTFLIISSYRLRYFNNDILTSTRDKVFSLEVHELNKKERDGLLGRYLKFEDIVLDIEDTRLISNLLYGFPEQVYYSVELIKEKGIEYLRNNTNNIVEYSNKKASILLKDIEKSIEKSSMLALLSSFDYIGFKFIYEIIDGEIKYLKFIDEFILKSICEYIGTSKEYIRVNEVIKDYVHRNNYKIKRKHKIKMEKNLKVFLNNISINDYDIPEYLFSLKEALKQGKKIDEKYLVPSLYLKTMSELYYNKKNKEVIAFAYKALEQKEFMEKRIAFEIRFLLCMALAKLRDQRFTEEVKEFEGSNYYFLYGFYYRQIGKFKTSLEMLNKSIEKRPKFSKVQREKVQVYIGMQEFQAAKELAKENYLAYMNNPYHIQAYFTCLIKSEKNNENKEILKKLIKELDENRTDIAKEMTLRCKAQLEAFYNVNKDEALRLIDEAINMNPNIHYASFVKFDICERFDMLSEMKEIYHFFENSEYGNKYKNTIVSFKAIIIAKEGKIDEAIEYFQRNIKNYTDEAKEKFIIKLKHIKSRNLK